MPRDCSSFNIFDGVNLKLSVVTFFEPPRRLLLTVVVPRFCLHFIGRGSVNDAVEVLIGFKNGGCDASQLFPTLRKSRPSKSPSLQGRKRI